MLAALERKIDAAENVPGGSAQADLAFLTGAGVERANSQLDGVETDLLRLIPDPYLRGQLPNLVAHVRDHLPEGDPRRTEVEKVAEAVRGRAPQHPTVATSSATRCSVRSGRPAWRRDGRSGACAASGTCCS